MRQGVRISGPMRRDLRFLTKVRGHVHQLAVWRASAGLFAGMRWEVMRLAVMLGLPEPPVWRVRPRQVAHPLKARLHGSSDMQVFDQIFIFQEYSCLRELNPTLVLDLGANVGFSTAYFLNIFPKARVVAVEPDERNFAVCESNLAPYGDRVLLLHGAVWSRTARLRLLKGAFGDGREWATQVVADSPAEEGTSADVQAWDVLSLIDMSGGNTVDLLKVDIERAELSVFGESAGFWLPKVRNICIELHGSDCEEVFFAALKDFDYELGHAGELTICRNLRRKVGAPALSGTELTGKA
jgi:FkbM family methyltransferase